MDRTPRPGKTDVSGVFKAGAISLAFLITGYQVAMFVHGASAERLAANRDRPDTVYVMDRGMAEEILSASRAASEEPPALPSGAGKAAPAASGQDKVVLRKDSPHPYAPRRVESFPFDPNTVSVEDLVRLGFSEKQARSIDSYRQKGGRFRRKSDFAKSFVVSDSVFMRLEPYIRIPKIDINKADSAAFDSLPGIGGWFARRMVDYRTQLHGYSCTEQLMEIYRFDQERYDGLKDLITCSPAEPYPFWSLPADSLRLHPAVHSWQTARAIVFYREHNPPGLWTVDGLLSSGVISEEQAERLRRCRLD